MTMLLFFAIGCGGESPTPPAESHSEPTVPAEAKSAEGCPPARVTTDSCIQVVVYARNPEGGCCSYPSPCTAPEGWEIANDEASCRAIK